MNAEQLNALSRALRETAKACDLRSRGSDDDTTAAYFRCESRRSLDAARVVEEWAACKARPFAHSSLVVARARVRFEQAVMGRDV
jgi:hypothetical protein